MNRAFRPRAFLLAAAAFLLPTAAASAQDAGAEAPPPKAVSACVKSRVLAEPGMQQRLIEQRLCAGGEAMTEGSTRPSSPFQARRCDQAADRIRREVVSKARVRCAEQVEPGQLADLGAFILDPNEQYDAASPGMRNAYNEKAREAQRQSLGEFESQAGQLEAVGKRYEELNLSDCVVQKVLNDSVILEQAKEVVACESPGAPGAGERYLGGATSDCKGKRRMLDDNLKRRATNRCREQFPREALEHLDVVLIGLGEPVVADVPLAPYEVAAPEGAEAEAAPSPKIIVVAPQEPGPTGVDREKLTIQRAGSAPGPVLITPGAGGAEPAPEMKTIDVRPFAPGVVAEPAAGADAGAAEPHTIEVQPTR